MENPIVYICAMRKIATYMVALVAASAAPLYSQETAPGACSTPESIVVSGASRVDTAAIRSSAGLSTGAPLNVHDIQNAIKALYATGQFDDVQITCRVTPPDNKATLVIQVRERPVLTSYRVIGADRVSPKDVKEKLSFPTGAPIDPGKIAKAIASADSLYESNGYYLAQIKAESTITNGKLSIDFHIDEGRRLAISGIRITGNKNISAEDIVGAMLHELRHCRLLIILDNCEHVINAAASLCETQRTKSVPRRLWSADILSASVRSTLSRIVFSFSGVSRFALRRTGMSALHNRSRY